MSASLLVWIKAVRLQYYPTSFLTLFVGLSVAGFLGIIHSSVIVWMVGANLLLHCSCSLINEYADFVSGADLGEYPRTSWRATGGSRVLVDKLLMPNHVLYGSFLLLGSSYVIWIWISIALQEGLLILILTCSAGTTFLYAAAFSKGGFSYIREVILTFGAVPLFTISVVRIMSGVYSGTALAAGLIVGMQMMNYLLYHGLLDLQADHYSGKLRLTRFLGEEKTLCVSEILTAGTFFVIGSLMYFEVLPLSCAVTVVLLPLAGMVIHAEVKRKPLVKTYTKVVILFVGMGVLLSLGFWLHFLI
ncbi:MAG: prenyltransferase [Theionarchaea archaeon]|nr:prenyltransferase [Theionarchaea archaeon]